MQTSYNNNWTITKTPLLTNGFQSQKQKPFENGPQYCPPNVPSMVYHTPDSSPTGSPEPKWQATITSNPAIVALPTPPELQEETYYYQMPDYISNDNIPPLTNLSEVNGHR